MDGQTCRYTCIYKHTENNYIRKDKPYPKVDRQTDKTDRQ